MDGWMNGWIDKWMDRCVDGGVEIDGWIITCFVQTHGGSGRKWQKRHTLGKLNPRRISETAAPPAKAKTKSGSSTFAKNMADRKTITVTSKRYSTPLLVSDKDGLSDGTPTVLFSLFSLPEPCGACPTWQLSRQPSFRVAVARTKDHGPFESPLELSSFGSMVALEACLLPGIVGARKMSGRGGATAGALIRRHAVG